jgi:hypothetical protein
MTDNERHLAAFRAGFQAGFAISREGFNGGCRYDHCAPDPFGAADDALQAAEDAAVKDEIARLEVKHPMEEEPPC